MYRIVIFCVIISTALAEVLNKKLCGRVFYPNAMRCCQTNSNTIRKFALTDDLIECFQLPKDPTRCERDICIAKKKGFATQDDKIDMNKLEELVTKDFGSDADLLADIKAKCINGDFEKYAPPDNCEFVKMRQCISMQLLNHCPDWSTNTECQETKGLIEECLKIIT